MPSMGQMMMAGIDFAYVGRAKCGCVRSIIVDDARRSRDSRRSVAEFLCDMAAAREALMDGRHCSHLGRQLELIAP